MSLPLAPPRPIKLIITSHKPKTQVVPHNLSTDIIVTPFTVPEITAASQIHSNRLLSTGNLQLDNYLTIHQEEKNHSNISILQEPKIVWMSLHSPRRLHIIDDEETHNLDYLCVIISIDAECNRIVNYMNLLDTDLLC